MLFFFATPLSQEDFDAGRSLKICEVHIEGAVKTFKECFDIFERIFQLFLMSCFIIGIAVYQNYTMDGTTPLTVAFIIVQPVITVLLTSTILVQASATALIHDKQETFADNCWSSFLIMCINLRGTIVDIGKGDKCVLDFVRLHDLYVERAHETKVHEEHTKHRTRIVPTAAVVAVALVLGAVVQNGYMSVATCK